MNKSINDKSNIVIVGLKDSDGYVKYAIYNDDKYELYNENKSFDLILLISKKELKGYKKTTVVINETKYDAYSIDKRFVLVYAMDLSNGKYNFYKYDTEDKTFQYFDTNSKEESKNDSINTILLIASIILCLAVVGLVVYIVLSKKKKLNK